MQISFVRTNRPYKSEADIEKYSLTMLTKGEKNRINVSESFKIVNKFTSKTFESQFTQPR
jgi:hypothetical protein